MLSRQNNLATVLNELGQKEKAAQFLELSKKIKLDKRK